LATRILKIYDKDRIHLFEEFTLNLSRGFLLRGDELVHLRPQTYEVLKYWSNTGRTNQQRQGD
jgi:DNA-binding winged helix-turn-helix (wHTH) protein